MIKIIFVQVMLVRKVIPVMLAKLVHPYVSKIFILLIESISF
jgi:hypothetical protein